MNTQLFFEWLIGTFIIFSSAPIGSLIVWNRISFVGDSLSHASLLGVSLSYVLNINYFLLNILLITIFLLAVFFIEIYSNIKIDAIINILTNIYLSLSIILLHILSKKKKIDIPRYFFGDLSKICFYDVIIIFLVSCIVIIILYFYWQKFLFLIISPDLAKINGVNILETRFILMFITAFTVSLAIQFFGVLLMTSLLVIPSSISYKFSSSPEYSIFISIIISFISLSLGIFISHFYNVPISPIIVLNLSVIFILSLIFKKN
ncbi:MAG: iron chelate uptake ABC transporter family permease subunit [Buchnera aphidicola (Periphyllus aceris)]|nr:iron chelate uptake ABC transporter family permease subunit [Buchnera aphidicola (Periphyllus aceris)]